MSGMYKVHESKYTSEEWDVLGAEPKNKVKKTVLKGKQKTLGRTGVAPAKPAQKPAPKKTVVKGKQKKLGKPLSKTY
tara:strand:+ start:564 stop:794 length:231 start_codon:yes stop_codon:yes gene_type:complete